MATGWAAAMAASSRTVTAAELSAWSTGVRKAVTTIVSAGASSSAWADWANRTAKAGTAKVAIRGKTNSLLANGFGPAGRPVAKERARTPR